MTSVFSFDAKQILCPVDRSELSSLALKYAVAGARVFGARVMVLGRTTELVLCHTPVPVLAVPFFDEAG